jgi:hypothetical protein
LLRLSILSTECTWHVKGRRTIPENRYRRDFQAFSRQEVKAQKNLPGEIRAGL